MTSRILASELYLVERWNAFTDADPNARRAKIFEEYLDLGVKGRWPYLQAARAGVNQPTPEQVTSILKASRTAHERRFARMLESGGYRAWLRTCYEGENLLASLDPDDLANLTDVYESDNAALLDDQSRYNYGESWEHILYCIPEIVHSYLGPLTPERHEERIRDVKEEVELELEFHDDIDEESVREVREENQHAWVTGALWVQDEETASTGNVLVIWLDEFGRVVRENRIGDVLKWNGLFMGREEGECEWWEGADVGPAYEGGNWP